MIKIEKPATPPAKLLEQAVLDAVEIFKQLFEADPDAYRQGRKKFPFKKTIYGHKSVKLALIAAQHYKCCFCERKTEMGDVEHYRGKGGWQQSEKDKIQLPGYFWLVYDWENLLFCCEVCNRIFKRNFFPLETPELRATAPFFEILNERPLIIHPAKEDPEQFIEYVGFHPRAIGGNRKGLETITRTGLGRPFIDDRRRNHYLTLKTIFLATREPSLSEPKRIELLKVVNEAARSESEYAGMVRWAIKHQFMF